jgi:branched-subunit amino acid ABC-type transport system permease component
MGVVVRDRGVDQQGATAVNSGTLVLGVLNGMTYGLLAAGFVLVYKSNRFLNVAHAQLGAVSALLLAKLVRDWGWNWWVAAALCTVVGIGVGMGTERWLIRPVRRRSSSPVRLLMLTIGVSQLLLVLTYMPFFAPDQAGGAYPQPFDANVSIGGVRLGGMSVLSLILVPLVLAGLTAFLGYTSIGRQIRAAANNPEAARLCGVSIDRVSVLTWGIAGALSALSAILSGPTTSTFNLASVGPYLLLYTMGAAAVGAFVSIPAAVAGGIGLGVAYQVVAAETSSGGKAQLAVFVLILGIVLVRGRAIAKVFAVSGAPVPGRRCASPPSCATIPWSVTTSGGWEAGRCSWPWRFRACPGSRPTATTSSWCWSWSTPSSAWPSPCSSAGAGR